MFAKNWLKLFGQELAALSCIIIALILRTFEVLHLDWFISIGEIRKRPSKRAFSNLRMLLVLLILEFVLYKVTVRFFSGNFVAIVVFCICTLGLAILFLYNATILIIISSRIFAKKIKSFFYNQVFRFWPATLAYLYNGCETDEEYIKIKNRYLTMYSLPCWTSEDMVKDKRYKILKFDAEVKKLLKKKLHAERCA